MKSKLILTLAIFFIAFTQMHTKKAAVGIGLSGTMGTNDYGRDEDIGSKIDVFLRHALSGDLEGELHYGIYGDLKRSGDYSYNTDFTTLDYRFLYRFYTGESVSTYVKAGLGFTFFDVQKSSFTNGNIEKSDDILTVPVGLGVQFKLDERYSLNFHADHNYTSSDNLNNFGDETGLFGDTDGFFSFGVAIIYGLGKDKPMAKKKDVVLVKDADGDGLSDNDEIMTYKTDHTKSDTDGDGLSDYAEIMTHKTDPLKADTDGDGLSDSDEINDYKTDAKSNADQDNDGLSDAEEILNYKTKFNQSDSDGDGLSDGAEIKTHKTDALLADTDKGSVNDGREVKRGTNPLNPDDDIIVEIKGNEPIVLDGITFKSGRSAINPESEAILKKVLNTFKAYPDLKVEIKGYTDNTGSYNGNVRLSQKRANAVRSYLINKGVSADRIKATGLGPANPIADNKTREGRAKNRRIEFSRLK